MKRLEWGEKPYSDGSGFEYTLYLEETDGKTVLGIKDAGGHIRIDADDWPAVSGRLTDMLRFAEGGKPRAGG